MDDQREAAYRQPRNGSNLRFGKRALCSYSSKVPENDEWFYDYFCWRENKRYCETYSYAADFQERFLFIKKII